MHTNTYLQGQLRVGTCCHLVVNTELSSKLASEVCCSLYQSGTYSAATTSPQSIEDILVLTLICGDQCTIGQHCPELHHIVDSQAQCVADRAMPSSGNPA